jgi:hypothetical protein
VRQILIAALLVSVSFAPLPAQENPSMEIYGGYSVETLRAPDGGCSRYSGWTAAFARRLFWKVSLAADLGGHYGREFEVVDNRVHTLQVGPRLTLHDGRISPFVHVLLGVSRLTSDSGGPVFTANAFSWSGGGGVDLRVTRRWSVRIFQIDYLSRQFFGESTDGGRISGGVVYHFGR